MSKISGIGVALALTVALASTPSTARVGKVCTLATDCGAREFCELAAGRCLTPGVRGRCAAIQPICAMIYQPVCGCNGEAYPNDCYRRRAAVSERHKGRC